MGVPKPAEIPGFIKKGIMDMKYQPNLFFNQHAIEDGWATPTSQHRRTPAPIIEEVESDSSQYTRGETSSSREYYNKIEYDMHVDNSSDVTNTQEIKEPKSTISFQPKKVIIKNL
uniref:Uncharacterized protein n=1 Tax=Acrobeloides nanus TaxID=290746 RepID=A0A914DZX1_9BILA